MHQLEQGVDGEFVLIGEQSRLPGDGQHGPHEYVDIITIEPYYRALTEFLTALTVR